MWNTVAVPAGAASSNIITLSPVSVLVSLSVADLPGDMSHTGPRPEGTMKPFASIVISSKAPGKI
jgi:hypothetical protein